MVRRKVENIIADRDRPDSIREEVDVRRVGVCVVVDTALFLINEAGVVERIDQVAERDDDRGNFEQEQAVLSEKFDHTAMPTLFFCSTCSAR